LGGGGGGAKQKTFCGGSMDISGSKHSDLKALELLFFFASSKIARLEDEIEQLKELHELKKQKDKLKKSKK